MSAFKERLWPHHIIYICGLSERETKPANAGHNGNEPHINKTTGAATVATLISYPTLLLVSVIIILKLKERCHCLTSGVDGDPVDGVFMTEVDCPVGILVTISGVDAVAVDVCCLGIIIDCCAAVIGEIRKVG